MDSANPFTPANPFTADMSTSVPLAAEDSSKEKFTGEFVLHVKARPTVGEMKQQIEADLRIPASIQRIIFRDEALENDEVFMSEFFGSRFTLEIIKEPPQRSSPDKDNFEVHYIYREKTFNISVDFVSTMAEIKQKIAEEIHILPSQFEIKFIGYDTIDDHFPVSSTLFGSHIEVVDRIGESSSSAPQPILPLTLRSSSSASQPISPLTLRVKVMKISDVLFVIPADFSVGQLKKVLGQRKDAAGVEYIGVYSNEVELGDEMPLHDRIFSELKVHLISAPPEKLAINVVHRFRISTDTVKTIRHQGEADQTLWDLRMKLEGHIVFPTDYFFILEREKRVMEDGVSFGDLGVKNNDKLHLINDKYEPFFL